MIPHWWIGRLLSVRGIHWLAVTFGTSVLRARSFDEKFRSGQWNFSSDQSSELVQVVEQYAGGGDILMLGCGTGSIVDALDPRKFATFMGIDISSEAITRARQRATEKVRFETGDILRYECPKDYRVILFSESIYYIKPWRRKQLLKRLQQNLAPGGAIIVTIAQPKRYSGILAMIRRSFHAIIDRPFAGSSRHLLVFN